MILGIAGHFGAGKDTLADYFMREHNFVRIGFADALKEEVRERFPRLLEIISREWSDGTIEGVFADKPPALRAMLQEYGTEVRRADDPDYWVKAWEQRWGWRGTDWKIVAPDVRFHNEAQRIKALGGFVVRVERPGYHGDGHASEALTDWPWDYVFQNTRSIEALHREARGWYAHITGVRDSE